MRSLAILALGLGLAVAASAPAMAADARLPLHRGTSHGRAVFYVVLESSDRVRKLANARGTAAVQRVAVRDDGTLEFPASVDFGPERSVLPGPGGFPPALARPGAVGEPGYSPLVELPDGTVLNAPQIANATGRADKVVALDAAGGDVVYRETEGRARGRVVQYASFDASDPAAAALEDVTYAPALDAAPAVDDDSTHSARASLGAVVNGATGAGDPERQGLNSAILDGLDPLNILRWLPQQGRYSPLWDVHLAAWQGAPRRISSWDALVQRGDVTVMPAGFIVNCPIISAADGRPAPPR